MTDFFFPFEGDHPVTSPYGPRGGGFHKGVDFGWTDWSGTHFPVCAAAAGTVVYYADEGKGGGRTLTLDHGNGEQSRYYHLDHPLVAVGDVVGVHQHVAISGETGEVDPHLHFEIHLPQGNPVDPLGLLRPWDGPALGVAGLGVAPPFPGTLLVDFTAGHGAATWQSRMAERGWSIEVNDQYGPASAHVCSEFQAEKGLAVDGIVGRITWDAAWSTPIT